MSEKTNQILMSVTTQATLPLFLQDQILLEMIMAYLTINLSIAWYLLIEDRRPVQLPHKWVLTRPEVQMVRMEMIPEWAIAVSRDLELFGLLKSLCW